MSAKAPLVYAVHGGCPDGLGGGWAVWRSLSLEVREALTKLGGLCARLDEKVAPAAAAVAAPVAAPAASVAAPVAAPAASVAATAASAPQVAGATAASAPQVAGATAAAVTAPAAPAPVTAVPDRWADMIRQCHALGLPAFIPLYRDKPAPVSAMAGCDVTIIDYTPSYAELSAIVKVARTVRVWDHHSGALATLDKVMQETKNLTVCTDMKRSGAQIAWDMVFPNMTSIGVPRPWVIEYIADRDLWTWKLPNSKLISRGLHAGGYLKSFETIDALMDTPVREMLEALETAGRNIEQYEGVLIDSICKGAVVVPLTVGGVTYKVSVVNSSVLRSEVGNVLAERKNSDFAIAWQYSHEHDVYWLSLRGAQSSPLDLDRVARAWVAAGGARDGGGHPKAAGVTIDATVHKVANIFKGL